MEIPRHSNQERLASYGSLFLSHLGTSTIETAILNTQSYYIIREEIRLLFLSAFFNSPAPREKPLEDSNERREQRAPGVCGRSKPRIDGGSSDGRYQELNGVTGVT